MIETGRFRGLELDERICLICDSGEIETECHFLFDCQNLLNIRRMFYEKIINLYPSFIDEDNETKLKIIMKQNIVKYTACYIKSAFEQRHSFI